MSAWGTDHHTNRVRLAPQVSEQQAALQARIVEEQQSAVGLRCAIERRQHAAGLSAALWATPTVSVWTASKLASLRMCWQPAGCRTLASGTGVSLHAACGTLAANFGCLALARRPHCQGVAGVQGQGAAAAPRCSGDVLAGMCAQVAGHAGGGQAAPEAAGRGQGCSTAAEARQGCAGALAGFQAAQQGCWALHGSCTWHGASQ